jgi:hypothetical protein
MDDLTAEQVDAAHGLAEKLGITLDMAYEIVATGDGAGCLNAS